MIAQIVVFVLLMTCYKRTQPWIVILTYAITYQKDTHITGHWKKESD